MVKTSFNPEENKYKTWNPSRKQLENMQSDRDHIERMYNYRLNFEPQWRRNMMKWNLLVENMQEDSGISNFVIPTARTATYTGVVAMRQSLPELGIIPGGMDDKKKVRIIKDADKHVDRMTNMEAVMDQMIIDYAVIGTGVLEDFVQTPYKTERKMILDKNGKKKGFEEIIRRDWSRPKIGTRARSPWECAFDPGARNDREIRACTFRDRLSFGEFVEKYIRRPKFDESFFENLDMVHPGVVYIFNKDNDLKREEREDKKVIIDHYQNEVGDIYRVYANGVLILDIPLSALHAHGKITLSLIRNHPMYDKNLKTHALYGAGDPQLLEDLDDLINAMTNQFITNYARKNTYVVGVANGGALDLDDIDYETGDVVTVPGSVNVQSLGAADLNEWVAFKTTVEEWAIQVTKKNWKIVEADAAKTAFEMRQKIRAANMGMVYQIKTMESSGLLEHKRKRVSDIMEHMTQEEVEEITEEEINLIREQLGQDIAQEDLVVDPVTRKPIAIKHREMFRTNGIVYDEKIIKGKRTVDSLRIVKEGEDGMVTAHKEYLQTREWVYKRDIPDIYLIGKTMLGEDQLIEEAKLDGFLNKVSIVAQADQSIIEKINFSNIIEMSAENANLNPDEVLNGSMDEKQQERDKRIEAIKQAILTPSQNVPQQTQANTQGFSPLGQGQEAVPVAPQGADTGSL